MYKFIIAGIICIFMATSVIASNSSKKPSGWADISSFCRAESKTATDYKTCIRIINRYKQATRKHFRNLSADQLKRIGDSIRRLADKTSKRNKSLSDAVQGIGDTIRKPIEVPNGVRRRGMQQQQRYVK